MGGRLEHVAILVGLTTILAFSVPVAAQTIDDSSVQATQQSAKTESSKPEASKTEVSKSEVSNPAKSTPPSFPIGSSVSRTLQKVTGITFISDVIASQAAKKVVHHKLGGKVKVKVKTFGLTDLIAGKIKSVSIVSSDGAYKAIPVGAFEIKSNNPIWFDYKKNKDGKRPGLQTPVMLAVRANLSNKDVVTALQSAKVSQQLSGLKLDLPGLGEQQLQVVRPKVAISNNDIKIEALLITKGAAEETGVPITISGTPSLVEDKLVLTNIKVDSPYIVEPEKFAAFAEELLNPILDFGKFDRGDHAFRLKELALKGDSVQGDGQLLIAPKPTAQIAGCRNVIK